MRRVQQQMNPGIGMAVLGLAAAIALAGCAPGTICNNPDYEQQCMNPLGGTGGGTGGTGGSTGGSGGSTGGSGGSPMMLGPNTAVANCPEFDTVGEADAFFARRCGSDAACHGSPVWTDMKMPALYMRLIDKAPNFTCKTAKLVNVQNWQQSLLYIKTAQQMPACPDGSTAALNTIMPPPENMQAMTMKQPPLSAPEKTCVENYVKVLAGVR